MVKVSSWGRLTQDEHEICTLTGTTTVAQRIHTHYPGVAHGMGRSYGDVCLNPGGILWKTTGLDRFICFDQNTGRLACEAGVLLADIQRLMVPRGWILPVTPGTQLITVGGAIANDVHGKNHHVSGSFGDHITRLKLVRTDGSIIECGPEIQPEWFSATVGGLGLTGVITEVEVQLRQIAGPWLDAETIPYHNLTEFFQLADSSEAGWEHTVSWIDCVSNGGGRGIFMRANPIDARGRKVSKNKQLTMPFTPPFSLVNRLTLAPFNTLYFHLNKWRSGRNIVHYEPFSYPLDNIHQWNRMYGPKGFFQYQSVVPRNVGQDAAQEMLRAVARSGSGSFLGVLKTFGERLPVGMLSFPRPGVTLALDFPNNGERTLKLFERLDAIVREGGGAVYLAKDARMPRDLFEIGYPRLAEFLQYRDPHISSALARRLIDSLL